MTLLRLYVYVLLAGLLVAAGLQYRSAVYEQGVTDERTRQDGITRLNNAAVEKARAALDARIAVLNTALTGLKARLETANLELKNEQTISAQRRADLLAGRTRERVLVRPTAGACAAPGANGQAEGATAGALDPGAGVEADLDPGVASWLERVRSDHNAAVERLGACVASYDAVKAAADAMP